VRTKNLVRTRKPRDSSECRRRSSGAPAFVVAAGLTGRTPNACRPKESAGSGVGGLCQSPVRYRGQRKVAVDAFISHSSKNRAAARRLEKLLEAEGLQVWLDDSEIRLGVLLSTELQTSIHQCRTFVLLWSKPAAASRWVNSEWLTAFHLDRLILPCVLDETRLPQCLQNSVYLNLRRVGQDEAKRLARQIREAGDSPTPLAPLMRAESPELTETIATIAQRQQDLGEALGRRELDEAAKIQAALDKVMKNARERWPLDPMIVNLDGYHLKNAYMVKHWDAIQAGRAPRDPLLDQAEWRFFETLSIDPTDPSALNGLGSILLFERDLQAAEFFIQSAIRAAERQGIATYPAAEQDLALVKRFQPQPAPG
jgi:TIR domain